MIDRDELKDKLFGTIDAKTLEVFKKYHAERPEIFSSFKKYSLEMRKTGRERYSAKCIIERIRWDHDMQYSDKDFKISNSMTSLYVRMLIWNNPEFIGFFQLKKVRGVKYWKKNQLDDTTIDLSVVQK